MAYYGTFMSRDRHCALRVAANKDVTRFVTLYEREGELVVDVRKLSTKDFEKEYCKELIDYPVRKAAEHFLHPLTTSIHVTETAKKLLEKIMTDEAPFSTKDEVQEARQEAAVMPKKAPKQPRKTREERNVEATKKASVRTDSEVHPAPVVKDTSNGEKQRKGTWDAKPNATEENRDAQRVAVRKHNEAKAKAAKKAERAAKRKETKAVATNEENTVNDTTKKTTAKKATKKAATKKAPAKKAATKKAPAKKAAPAKKTAKATKLARGTGKGKAAAPARGGKGKAEKAAKKKGRPGRYTEDQKITLVTKENPRREGTNAYKIFELLKKSKSVGDFYAKGGGANNLRFNEEQGHIKVS